MMDIKTLVAAVGLFMGISGVVGSAYVTVFRVEAIETRINQMDENEQGIQDNADRLKNLEIRTRGIDELQQLKTDLAIVKEILQRVERKLPNAADRP